ncbi:MAG: ECF transporter S component [Oscillospiraceae bacterium]|nr:ECF transporter S component [Oscillospiraceae bacterium]
MSKKLLPITQTAIFIALLIVSQMATAPLGNQLVTGSIVNMILIVSVMTCGLASGLTVAAISNVAAKLLGIGPLWSLIPFIAVGNMVLVLTWHFVGNRHIGRKYVSHVVALVCAAAAKFLTLYLGIVKIAVPLLLDLPEKQAAVISGMFSVTQLITASIGGALAIVLLPTLFRGIRRQE